jgi:hypothetical protein
MGTIFIDPKSSEILSVFPCTTQIALFWPKLLTALFLKKPSYPCPFEILVEALCMYVIETTVLLCRTYTKGKTKIVLTSNFFLQKYPQQKRRSQGQK